MATEEPLDEVLWSAPHRLAEMQGIHTNSVLHYFADSPFFDRTSNNAVITSQAMYNQAMHHAIQTRESMERHLSTMSGLEFVVAQAPAETAPGTGTGVWVIRKQTRRKRPSEEDEIIVHSTYYVVGEHVYMAPTIADVLGCRMLSILSSISNVVSTATALPDFSPALGHTYMPPPKASRPKVLDSQLSQASKENTPLPDSMTASKKVEAVGASFQSNRLLEETLNITLRYGDDYMDENPITGQPGSFNLSSTGRKEPTKLAVPTVKPLQMPGKVSPSAPTLKTDIAPEKKTSKTDKSPRTPGGKLKRRKSKIGATSPT